MSRRPFVILLCVVSSLDSSFILLERVGSEECGGKRPLFALQRSKDTPEKYQVGKEQKESGPQMGQRKKRGRRVKRKSTSSRRVAAVRKHLLRTEKAAAT